MNPLKTLMRRSMPRVLNAFHEYRQKRALRRRQPRPTPRGFRFAGHDEMENGTFEPAEAAVIEEFARSGCVYIDVGANYGYFVAIARSAGAHVVAIEPLQQNVEMLYANLDANAWSDVEVLPVGLASKPGVAKLYGGGTAASLVPHWAGTSEVWQRTIAISTLDNVLCGRFEKLPMLIKIDVEGAEREVLLGAQKTLARSPAPAWLVEICFRENQPGGVINADFRAIFELFWKNGYRATTVANERRDVTPSDVERWMRNGQRDFGYVNYLFQCKDGL